MASQFAASVNYGLGLSKRIFYGKGTTAPPVPEMLKSPDEYLPTAPMVYAIVPDPAVVDNPDVPSYQPYVHGRCDPPALIPLHMCSISAEIDCCLDTAFVSIAGLWRVHCIMASRRCDCCVAIPMGEQGLLLGVEISIAGRSYNTELIEVEQMKEAPELAKAKEGQFLKFRSFRVEGGSTLSIQATLSQKLVYHDSEFHLSVPFSFPEYVNPVPKKISKREKIELSVNTGTSTEVLCRSTSHPMKELKRGVGKLAFSYEREAATWSGVDINLSYAVFSSDILGEVLLQSPPLHDFDQRELFCLCLYPGNSDSTRVFRKEVVYVIDVSGSMQDLLISVKDALLESLSMLSPQDAFNIIAFNDEAHLFSSSMEMPTKVAISNASQWISNTFMGKGGTNILLPLEQAMNLLADTVNAIPLIFLVTDGSVENEREICNIVKSHLSSGGLSVLPRFCTFGIGQYCNHYFLQTLAQIGRGHYDTAFDEEDVAVRMGNFFTTSSSIIVADLSLNAEELGSFELFPSCISDLSSGRPLIVGGRYSGDFPEFVKLTGSLADGSVFTKHLNVKRAKDISLDRVLAKRQIEVWTAGAWLQESKELEEKVGRMSVQYGVPSEFTSMILLETVIGKGAVEQKAFMKEVYDRMSFKKLIEWKGRKAIVLGTLCNGFGNLEATRKNIKPGMEEPKPADATAIIVNAASTCCSRMMDKICCMCFIQTCSALNDRCTVMLTQLSTALACFECLNCCFEVCDCCSL
ncbi:hypothetical protein SAY87_017086 [Trapa incisa]|uniref:VWFA domain-containing protein n=1 Tax=Trapa incisa TaxID=236973 RepID=A0AAN7QYL4_9MYRT|nr:hypothetical protein SAY87_017086 [Trapa incisa]